ncbi:bacterio-opsin activator domain-containing protein [Natronoglomus mannanivorans]|uniref:Helix-turn-helix domain-containing protein n=1 Tax=Natronoglomus mannanivorans TaxID=2979990 RepID=A0AAP2YXK8_9EURY|nr:helix-turn-helix domain-containing protein [Halobacteria archaeon AArc-xg1-1]
MSLVAVNVSLPSESFAMGRVLQNGLDVRIELARFVPTGESTVPYLWVESTDLAAFEAAVRKHDRVAHLTALDEHAGRTLFRVGWTITADPFLDAIVDHDLLIEHGTGTAETWQFQLRSPGRENLSAFQQTLQDHEIPIEVQRVWNPTTPTSDQYGLTPKQRDALYLAFREGYFDIPRETSLSALGAELDITGQSFSRRLRRGTFALLSNTILEE